MKMFINSSALVNLRKREQKMDFKKKVGVLQANLFHNSQFDSFINNHTFTN